MNTLALEALDPLNSPSWRWSRARSLVLRYEFPDRQDDRTVRSAWHYARFYEARGSSRVMAEAHRIFVANEIPRWRIEAYLLCGVSVAEVAEQLKLDARVIQAYAEVFFDVLPRLKAYDWIHVHIISEVPVAENVLPESYLWKAAAVAGGRPIVDLLVDDYLLRQAFPFSERNFVAERFRILMQLDRAAQIDKRTLKELLRRAREHVQKFGDLSERKELQARLRSIAIGAGLSRERAGSSESTHSLGNSLEMVASEVTNCNGEVMREPSLYSGEKPQARMMKSSSDGEKDKPQNMSICKVDVVAA